MTYDVYITARTVIDGDRKPSRYALLLLVVTRL